MILDVSLPDTSVLSIYLGLGQFELPINQAELAYHWVNTQIRINKIALYPVEFQIPKSGNNSWKTYRNTQEAVARAVRGNERPFGGIQLVLAGDFLQLPPVTRRKEERTFCFETAAWQKCVHVNLELTAVKRQSDSRFVNILRSLRNGRCSEEDAAVLKATASNDNIDSGGDIVASKLCTHSDDVDHINR